MRNSMLMKKIHNIFLEPTDKTPMVDFNQLTGELILSGRSIPENTAKIYEPLLIWTQDYVKNAYATTNLRLNLEYFNTATSIWISKIIKTLCGIEDQEKVLFIHLYFNIEDFNSVDDVEDDIVQITNSFISNDKLSVGIKIYGTDDNGTILKESMVFI
jgi:hypothetical protein